jgi:molecular chaperone DnaK (HSP70)
MGTRCTAVELRTPSVIEHNELVAQGQPATNGATCNPESVELSLKEPIGMIERHHN